jgi:hypothetical protein
LQNCHQHAVNVSGQDTLVDPDRPGAVISLARIRGKPRQFAAGPLFAGSGVSFPIAFDKAIIYGAEGKIEIPHWGLSYSYMVGNAWFPVTGVIAWR